ncbi:MAG: hypothetical protein DI539_08460 [Flavobacterium psychrophilum]|nr:MAG: hypothetical protein DI539_08460 [Flavobacterium psychrophilum]
MKEKLTSEQIQFIDDRLYNLGVKYIDIRYEMVDHIASEIETMDGDFGENWTEYFITHHNDILKQNRRAKWTATIRALKLYFKTMAMPMVLLSAVLMGTVAYYASFFVENEDVNMYGLYVIVVMVIPAMWFGRKNKELSVMRPLVLIYSVIFNLHQISQIISYRIDDKALRVIPRRIAFAILPALLLVLIVSLYRCRKQYVGKYI